MSEVSVKVSAAPPPGSTRELFCTIERVTPEGGDWCLVPRAQTLASIVLALRPAICVEIGVWMGGSAIPMLLALRHIDRVRNKETDPPTGKMIAIDPWSVAASIVGQNEVNATWWGNVDHEAAYQAFCTRLRKHELEALCEIVRQPSDEVEPPPSIDLLSVDGNHAAQAIRDVERFGSRVRLGGILALDDLDWDAAREAHVHQAHARAIELGFVELYRLGSGCVMQRAHV